MPGRQPKGHLTMIPANTRPLPARSRSVIVEDCTTIGHWGNSPAHSYSHVTDGLDTYVLHADSSLVGTVSGRSLSNRTELIWL